MTDAVWSSGMTGAATLVGTALALRFGRLSPRWMAVALGLSATVMLFVSLFELLPTALKLRPSWSHVFLGMLSGSAVMAGIRTISGDGEEADSPEHYRRLGWVLSGAVLAHNLPEGAAIGIGFGVEPDLGVTLALTMGLHNLPEGIGMAAPLLAAGLGRGWVILISLGAAGALPVGAWLGVRYLTGSPDLVAVGLLFASTTMIWVVTQEIFPRAYKIAPAACRWGLGLGILLALAIHGLNGSCC
ncbi:ZIP family zinc transporter [Melghirimyces profundicolus]|uniref:ZIP family zinc transporter n=1 Tax=Melghirimyces profundicolus TaxID=1242148 RepID=A0A2T6C2I2_9BACL|nr:ZIP family metal transporter [Melghirimyces profundicolus]PTX62503.1 ZIP family zinc transporter [Melghirimyces profundicolus]